MRLYIMQNDDAFRVAKLARYWRAQQAFLTKYKMHASAEEARRKAVACEWTVKQYANRIIAQTAT